MARVKTEMKRFSMSNKIMTKSSFVDVHKKPFTVFLRKQFFLDFGNFWSKFQKIRDNFPENLIFIIYTKEFLQKESTNLSKMPLHNKLN